MSKIFTITFTIATLVISTSYAQEKDSIKLGALIVSFNVGNAIALRPQISIEYLLSPWNSIEITGGYIAQNKSLQENTVGILNEDAFLSKGYHIGLGYKRMSAVNFNGYFGVQTYFKKHSYQNEVWHNGPKKNEVGSMSYGLSNDKTQVGVFIVIGSYKPIGNIMFLNLFGGFGMLYYQYNKTYHERVYDNSLRFKYKEANNPEEFKDIDTPFKEEQNKFYPIIHLGAKLGFSPGKK
ncbi:MAG: hypothetical protein JKY42_11755 [Flavobacteriales bacterium]|nr:hypothetical protein [Flavobacteriales bacterium]